MANVINNLSGKDAHFQILPSAARTASPDSQEFEGLGKSVGPSGARNDLNAAFAGLVVVVDVTAVSGIGPSMTVKIEGVDRTSGKTYTLLTSAAITAVGTTVLRVRPGLTASANLTANDVLPPVFRVSSTHANADSLTYSISGSLIR